jgi:phosphoglycolate phosphatase-like HAD superfamily hydrolase
MNKLLLAGYRSLFFDCDGVVLNSNKIKTAAFYKAALPYGEISAQRLVDYHIANGGVSRYQKFNFLLEEIVTFDRPGPSLDELLNVYATEVRQGLLECEIAEGLVELREKTATADWFIVSGGDQCELREVFDARGLSSFFNGGIYGSPATKDEILSRLLDSNVPDFTGLFLGDSKYDYESAARANLDFVFINHWTEVEDWQQWCAEYNLRSVEKLNQL